MREYKNVALLKELVESRRGIFPVSFYWKEDGSSNAKAINALWDKCLEGFEKTKLWEETPGFDDRDPDQCEPYLIFVPSEEETPRGTILVTHGGGFETRTSCEGPNVAHYFHRMGYNTAILTYRLLPYGRSDSVADELRAVKVIRAHTEEWKTNGQVIVMGFSAGAMLSANAATIYQGACPESEDPVERCSDRPDAAVISYGAMSYVSFPGEFGSEVPQAVKNLYGATAEERFRFAPEKHVTPDTPPMFIWQTMSDDGRFGMCLAGACQEAGVPYELHIFEGGVHGLGLADGANALDADVPHIRRWADMTDEWLKIHGIG